MKASLQNKKAHKQIADLYKEDKFFILLQDIINDPKSVIWMPFIQLYQGGKGEECLTLANTLVNSKDMRLDLPLLEYLLTEPGLLTEIQVQDFLFSKPAAILKIIPIRGWSDEWLLKLVNQYLLKLDISSLFLIADLNPERDSLIRVFSELSKLLADSVNIEEQNVTPIKAIVEAITAINRYAVDAPALFKINEFENHLRKLSDYSKKIEKNEFKIQVIEYLASCVKKHAEKDWEYRQMDGKFILLLICLKSPTPTLFSDILIKKGIFEYGNHNKYLPKSIPDTPKNLEDFIFSGYKNGWIKNFRNSPSRDSNFDGIRNKIADQFRLKYMVMARCYLWVAHCGKILLRDLKKEEYYNFGRYVTLCFIIIVIFPLTPPFIGDFILGSDSNNEITLTGTEILNSIIFGLISLTWGFNAYFSKANNLAKSNKQNEKIINQMKFFVALWSVVGVLLSVFFCFQYEFSCPFYAVLFIEFIWFVGYFIITKEDPILLFLKPDLCNFDQ